MRSVIKRVFVAVQIKWWQHTQSDSQHVLLEIGHVNYNQFRCFLKLLWYPWSQYQKSLGRSILERQSLGPTERPKFVVLEFSFIISEMLSSIARSYNYILGLFWLEHYWCIGLNFGLSVNHQFWTWTPRTKYILVVRQGIITMLSNEIGFKIVPP